MQIKVFGSGIEIGDSLREFIIHSTSVLVKKYIEYGIEASAYVKKDRKIFTVEIVLHISSGFIIKTDFESEDPYKAVTLALNKLENRIKKHKNRLKDKHRRNNWEKEGYVATDYILERKEHTAEKDEEHLVIAEQEKVIFFMTVSEAVSKLDLSDVPVVMFKNADNGKINVVYKRKDGHIGWIDYQEK